jgi:hypothetical protein
MKKFLILLIALCMISCNDPQWKDTKYHSYKVVCLDGVEYWKGHNRLAPRYNRDGSIRTCEEEE